MIKHLLYLIIGAGLTACSSVNTISVKSESIGVTSEYDEVNKVDSIVMPYRDQLESEMLEVIAVAENDFTRGRPNGSLNNWSADAILNAVSKSHFKEKPYFCLLNFGGLRNPFSQGDIVLGDVYKLMPFDNEIVIVELPYSKLDKIANYLIASGGEPISNAILDVDRISIAGDSGLEDSFFVVTSDYLMNGGDNMNFFQDQLNVIYTGILMRDAMIDQVKKQKSLIFNDDERIILE